MRRNFYIETYGCQMNVYDSELVAKLLADKEYSKTESAESADLIFVNTCSVRDGAESRVLARLDQLSAMKKQRSSLVIGVLGCVAQNLKDRIIREKPQVNFVLGPDSYGKLPSLLEVEKPWESHTSITRLSKKETYDNIYPLRSKGSTAWVAIMRGCDKFCTFCIVPFTRGRERSKSTKAVIAEVRAAAEEGYPEVTLLGQNVNSYRDGETGFPELLRLVAKIDSIRRIRFTSPHPQDASNELIRVMAEEEKVCKQIHLPLQSGSDSVLERMNRNYTRAKFVKLAKKFRENVQGIAIGTDIIVGFPGETEEDFERTLDVVREVRFDSAFTFKYSERPHTVAAKWEDDVPEEVKGERLSRLIELQKRITLESNAKFVGKRMEVLVERESKKSEDHLLGRTDCNRMVIFPRGESSPGDFMNVILTDAAGVTLFGEPAVS